MNQGEKKRLDKTGQICMQTLWEKKLHFADLPIHPVAYYYSIMCLYILYISYIYEVYICTFFSAQILLSGYTQYCISKVIIICSFPHTSGFSVTPCDPFEIDFVVELSTCAN